MASKRHKRYNRNPVRGWSRSKRTAATMSAHGWPTHERYELSGP
jgi:hypothetical protein